MPSQSNVAMPCGRKNYCGKAACAFATKCSARQAAQQAAKAQYCAAQGKSARPLASATDIVYIYDGSLQGFYSCVFESVYSGQLPCDVWPHQQAEPTLYPTKEIATDFEKAARVRASVKSKISARALELVETVFLSCMPQKELAMLKFLLLGYSQGAKTPHMMGHAQVYPLLAAEKHLLGEAHLLKGFVRFADYGGALAAHITPKNFVLPFLAEHFAMRYSSEQFMIYDKTHKAALIHQNRKSSIVPLDDIQHPEVSDEELQYQALWKQFYNTIAIEARTNPRCRMSNMPKRYWENMLEVSELL